MQNISNIKKNQWKAKNIISTSMDIPDINLTKNLSSRIKIDKWINFTKKNKGNDHSTEKSDDEMYTNHKVNLQELKQLAINKLESCKNKKIIFAIKTNVGYYVDDPIYDDSPLPEKSIFFCAKEYLHIVEKLNYDWWIGYSIKQNSFLGLIPSANKIEFMRSNSVHCKKIKMNEVSISMNTSSFDTENKILQPKNKSSEENISQSKESPVLTSNIAYSQSSNNISVNLIKAKKQIFKKIDKVNPYETVPIIRPIILIGPSLKGYEITDMLQKGVVDFLKSYYNDRFLMYNFSSESLLTKSINDFKSKNKKTSFDQDYNINKEKESIYNMCSGQKIVLLHNQNVNYPNQIQKSGICPIIIMLKIDNPKVLSKLIKTRNKGQILNMNLQLMAGEKLCIFNEDQVDIVITENILEEACETIATNLDIYWDMTHPEFMKPSDYNNYKDFYDQINELNSNLNSFDCSRTVETYSTTDNMSVNNISSTKNDLSMTSINKNTCSTINNKMTAYI